MPDEYLVFVMLRPYEVDQPLRKIRQLDQMIGEVQTGVVVVCKWNVTGHVKQIGVEEKDRQNNCEDESWN
jgi:hypothetical protein